MGLHASISIVTWFLTLVSKSHEPLSRVCEFEFGVEGVKLLGGPGDLVSRLVLIGVTPFRVLITLLITYLPSPLPLQVDPKP